jgi:hypothetical protein
MLDKELQNIWKNVETTFEEKSKKELKLLLESKAKSKINKFLFINAIAITIIVCFMTYLFVSSYKNLNDYTLLTINSILFLVIIIGLISAIRSYQKLEYKNIDQNFKKYLNEQIKFLDKNLKSNHKFILLIFIPVFYSLTVISIHTSFSNFTALELLDSWDKLTPLLFGAIIGLTTAITTSILIRNYQIKNLNFLKDLHERIDK